MRPIWEIERDEHGMPIRMLLLGYVEGRRKRVRVHKRAGAAAPEKGLVRDDGQRDLFVGMEPTS